jgi:hypothetical protein
MKKLLVALILLMAELTYAQKQTCNCPPNEFGYPTAKKADTIFHLSNGKSIALCGYRNTDIDGPEGKNVYSEFVLAVCGEKQVIKFWGAVLYCRLKVVRDTLFVETIDNFPTGKSMAYKWTVWTTEPIYFKQGKAVRDFRFNRQIPKYSEQEIQAALKQYQQAIKIDAASNNPNRVNNVNMEIADKLFVSAISSSKQAKIYLTGFDKHFGGLSGEYLEWYDDLMRKMKEWDTNISSNEH